jgi:DNA transposition AAA+ family ATPase
LGTPPVQPGQHPPAVAPDQPNGDLHPVRHDHRPAAAPRGHPPRRRPSGDIERSFNALWDPFDDIQLENDSRTELLIIEIDEADRLKTSGLEQLRDFFDRSDMGMILIGMPGFDRQLARYPQLYSRVGFAHQYRPLDVEDIPDVLAHYWQQLGLPFDPTLADEAANTVTRITGGNFRLIERLMSQVGRVLEINQLDTSTPEVVEAARQTLVVGAQ